MTKNKRKENVEIQRPTKDKITIGGSISISGNINSSAVIVGNNNTVENIAGGDVSGDIYKTSQAYTDLNDLLNNAIKKYVDDKEQADFLNEAIQTITNEIKKGDKIDEGFVTYLLRSVGKISPDILEIYVTLILSQRDIPPRIMQLFRSTLSTK